MISDVDVGVGAYVEVGVDVEIDVVVDDRMDVGVEFDAIFDVDLNGNSIVDVLVHVDVSRVDVGYDVE